MYLFLILGALFLKMPTVSSDCAKLSPPVGGHFIGICDNAPKSTCIIQCGNSPIFRQRTCSEEGTWSGGIILCPKRRKRCRALQAPENGFFVNHCRRTVGSVCIFACNPGYTLKGVAEIVCLPKSFRWSAPEPTCTKEKPPITVTCPGLNIPNFGARYGNCYNGTFVGSLCFFTCAPGYKLIGENVLECTIYGSWNASAPICVKEVKPAECPSLTPPLHGRQFGQCNPGKENQLCNYICNRGYYLIGVPSLRCQKDGTWSGPPPICIKGNGCKLPLNLDKFFITHCKSFYGGKCYYHCKSNSTFGQSLSKKEKTFNLKYAFCNRDGTWNKPFDCPKKGLFNFLSLLGK